MNIDPTITPNNEPLRSWHDRYAAPTGSARTGNTTLHAQRSFAEALSIADRRVDAKQSPKQEARAAAEQFVAVTLVQPLLKQLRETNNAAEPFAPGEAEKQFRALHDATLAHEIVSAGHWPLVDRLARDLLQKSQSASETTPSAQSQSPRSFIA